MTLWELDHFLNWHKSQPILEKFRAKYFAVLAGFEEGVNRSGAVLDSLCSRKKFQSVRRLLIYNRREGTH